MDDFIKYDELESDIQVEIVTKNPYEITDYLKNSSRRVTGLYFLDIDLNHKEISGIELANQIRKLDPHGFIVIITQLPDSLPLVFKFKIEALDFINKIEKDIYSINGSIANCVRLAYRRTLVKAPATHKILPIQEAEGKTVYIPMDEILYIKTLKSEDSDRHHMLELYTTTNKAFMFRGYLNNIEKDLDDHFARICQTHIINVDHVDFYDKATRKLAMIDGEEIKIPIRKVNKIKELNFKFRGGGGKSDKDDGVHK